MPDILLWSGPSIIAEALQALRSFKVPNVRFSEQVIWDYANPDYRWPGFLVYLRENDYDMSKLDTGGHTLDQDMSMILDRGVDDTGECRFFRYCP